MTSIREIAENLAHDISNPFDDGKPVVEVAIKEMALAALREFGEELAKIADAIADAECEKLTAAKNAEGNTELGRKFQHSVWIAFAIAERIRAVIRESL